MIQTEYTYQYEMPSLTVDVVAIRFAPKAQVLLITRANEPFKGAYALPGGFVNAKEAVEDAAARELKEETGLVRPAISPDALIGVYSHPGRDPRGWVVSAAYAIYVVEDEAVEAADDAATAQWVDVADLGSKEFAFDHRQIIEAGLRHYGLAFPQ